MNERIVSKLIWVLLLVALAACGGAQDGEPAPLPTLSQPDVLPTATSADAPLGAQEQVTEAAPLPATVAPPTTVPPTVAPPTEAPLPTPEVVVTPTAEATPTATTAPPPDVTINGMAPAQFIVMPPDVVENVRAIYAQGQALGRNPNTFSILGDSLIATPQSLAQLEKPELNLAEFAYLQPTLDQFSGSFGRFGPSVRVGLHSWSVFDPLWADKDVCLANEDLLACEIRLQNPSVMLIFLGSNDAGVPGGFKLNYEQVVQSVIDNGVVPILATKADRFEGPDNANNTAVREVAAALQLPLLEFDLLADTLPGRGLGPDNVHLTFLEPPDYSSPGLLSIGYPVHNLATLMILDEVRQVVSGG